MTNLPHAKHFADLIVYQKSRELSLHIFKISRRFPKEETYSLTDQVRRASRSIGAQIAESWAKRRYERHFISKLSDADGELLESQHWITTAADCEYITPTEQDALFDQCQEIGRLLHGMMDKSAAFCANPPTHVRETAAEYFTDVDDCY